MTNEVFIGIVLVFIGAPLVVAGCFLSSLFFRRRR